MSRRFARFACIDWSGARGTWQRGIAVATCEAGDAAPMLVAPPGRRWSRQDALDWLLAHAASQADMLIGIDFSAALPFDPIDGYLPGIAGVPRDARGLWRFVDEACAADPDLAATGFLADPEIARHFRIGTRTGDRFAAREDRNGRLRIVERDAGSGRPSSCFNLVGAAQVGLSSLTGMRMLHRLAGRIPVWPFDPVPASGPLIVEIYTTIAARAAGVRGGSKLRSWEALDTALGAIGSRPTGGTGAIDDHSADAILTAAWMRGAARDAALWVSPPPAVARTEGWTFGVGYRKDAAEPA